MGGNTMGHGAVEQRLRLAAAALAAGDQPAQLGDELVTFGYGMHGNCLYGRHAPDRTGTATPTGRSTPAADKGPRSLPRPNRRPLAAPRPRQLRRGARMRWT